MHEAPIAHDKVTRAPINLRCGYCYNSANVPLVMLLVLHAYGPRLLNVELRNYVISRQIVI